MHDEEQARPTVRDGLAYAARRVTYPEASFLGECPPADVEQMFVVGVRRAVYAGELLCREGDPGTEVVILLSGYVKLTKTAENGRQTMLELRGPGDVLGDMSVVDGGPQSANAIAMGPLEVCVLAASRFDELRRAHVGIANALLAVVVRRLRQASTRQLELGTADSLGRVCRRLVDLAASHGEPHRDGVLVQVLSQQELADWAGVSRDGVVRALQYLRDAGFVDSGRGRIVIKDLAAVTDRAGRDGMIGS